MFEVLFLVFSFIIASIIFAFTLLWYSKIMFFNVIKNLQFQLSLTKSLILEFFSSFLIAISTMITFVGFNINAVVGFINGFAISVSIILPIAISIAIWGNLSIKNFFVFTAHRVIQLVIAFTCSGFVNNIIVF